MNHRDFYSPFIHLIFRTTFSPIDTIIDDFMKGDETEPASHFLDFYLQTWYKNLTQHIKGELQKYLLENSKQDEGGKWWFNGSLGMIIVDYHKIFDDL